MVFDTLESSKEFYKGFHYGDRTYECEVLNPKKYGPYVDEVFSRHFDSLLQETIKKKKQKKAYFQKPPWTGTVFCDAIKLIKEAQ
jgi:hypothetical protein